MSASRRAGYTLVEVAVAVVLLTVGALALLGGSRVAALSLHRATLESRVAHLLSTEVERLRFVPVDSLAGGLLTLPQGTSSWTVTDSTGYRLVELVVRARPEGGRTLVDTVFLFRPR